MSDLYKFRPDLADLNSRFKALIDDYGTKVQNLSKISGEISSSSAWKDDTVKGSFNNSFNSYIKTFEKFKSDLDSFSTYLNSKSAVASAIEDEFSKG